MKIEFVAVLTLVMSGGMCSLCQAANTDSTETYTVQLVGTDLNAVLQAGEMKSLTAIIRNAGPAPIRAAKVFLSNCGCEGGTATPEVIPPGETAKIKFVPSTGGTKSGISTTRLVLRTSDGKMVPVNGEVNYTIRRDVALSPGSIELGVSPSKSSFDRIIQLTVVSGEQPQHISGSCPMEDVRVEVDAKSEPQNRTTQEGVNGRTYRIRVSGRVPQASGVFSSYVDLVLAGFQGRDHVFRIPVSGRVPDKVEITPRQFFMGYVHQSQEVTKELSVTYPVGQRMSVESVAGPDWMRIDYTTKDVADGRLALNLKMKVVAASVKTGTNLLHVLVKLDGESLTIDIPCVAVGKSD